MATWSGPRDNSNQAAAIRSGGLTSLRSNLTGWTVPVLSSEGIGVHMDATEPLDDPSGWFGDAYLDSSGEFHTPYSSYATVALACRAREAVPHGAHRRGTGACGVGRYQFQDLPNGLGVTRRCVCVCGALI